MAMMTERAVFLDKDGTLIEDVPYNVDPALMRFLPGTAEGLRAIHAAGFRLIVVSNQSGVARGYFPETALAAVEARLRAMFAEAGVPLAGFYYCPHHPDGSVDRYAVRCHCRKPSAGMVERAARPVGQADPAHRAARGRQGHRRPHVPLGAPQPGVELGRAEPRLVEIAVAADMILLLADVPDPERRYRLYRESGGNPLLLEPPLLLFFSFLLQTRSLRNRNLSFGLLSLEFLDLKPFLLFSLGSLFLSDASFFSLTCLFCFKFPLLGSFCCCSPRFLSFVRLTLILLSLFALLTVWCKR